MSNQKPEQIVVGEYVLKPIPATLEFAKLIFDIYDSDKESFRFIRSGYDYKSVDEVLNQYNNSSSLNIP